MKKISTLLIVSGLTLSLAACNQNGIDKAEKQNAETSETVKKSKDNIASGTKGSVGSNDLFTSFSGKIEHIHGLGYVGNQNAIFFATHNGLKVFENGSWFKTKEENNDYMGFNAVQKGFYTSGHPGVDSELPNPLGIKRSFDNGKTLENLDFEGETDFHIMGVGYENNVIYALSPNKNSIMKANKLYISENDTKTWQEVDAKGMSKEVFSIAVHPTNPNIVAVASKEGIYLSEDKGKSFNLINKAMQGTTVFFTNDYLLYGDYKGEARLTARLLTDGSEEEITLPELTEDAVMYIAQNPKNKNEIVFNTFNGYIYQTEDGAKTWNLLVKEGNLLSMK